MSPASQNTTEAANSESGDKSGSSQTVTIGIIGGGQLGRLLCLNADERFTTVVLSPSKKDPAAQVCDTHIEADFDDLEAVAQLANICDVITYEFENVSTETLAQSNIGSTPLRPNIEALTISQDRYNEKTFLQNLGIETAAFAQVDSVEELQTKAAELSTQPGPVLVKTRRFGYDGKGQYIYDPTDPGNPTSDPTDPGSPTGDTTDFTPSIIEALITFDAEISVIGARSTSGKITCYEPARNYHSDGILRRSTVPCGFSDVVISEAKKITTRILEALDYVGVIGVEFFVANNRLIVNEFAPRVHNSGHWTEAVCDINQFAQHMYAVAGFEIDTPKMHNSCEMFNLIGDEIEQAETLANEADTLVTLYHKSEVRPGRKMGHYTRILT